MGKELFKTFVFVSFLYFTEEQKTTCKHKLNRSTAQRKMYYIWSIVVVSENVKKKKKKKNPSFLIPCENF